MYVTVKARWMDEKAVEREKMGLNNGKEEYQFKEVDINLDRIAYIEEYEGYCYVAFSAINEDGFITNIRYSERDLFKKSVCQFFN